MNTEYRHLLPADFAPDSRVWVYQCSRLFTISEALQIEEMLASFTAGWNSHGTPVKGYGNIFFGRFIVLMADESATGVSGCSTDSSVRLIKEIEARFNVSMFDRQSLAFRIKEKIEILPLNQLSYAINHHFVDWDTIYFNNLVQSKQELENQWMIPLKESWLAKKLNLQSAQS
jgi:hypothetical protein